MYVYTRVLGFRPKPHQMQMEADISTIFFPLFLCTHQHIFVYTGVAAPSANASRHYFFLSFIIICVSR